MTNDGMVHAFIPPFPCQFYLPTNCNCLIDECTKLMLKCLVTIMWLWYTYIGVLQC